MVVVFEVAKIGDKNRSREAKIKKQRGREAERQRKKGLFFLIFASCIFTSLLLCFTASLHIEHNTLHLEAKFLNMMDRSFLERSARVERVPFRSIDLDRPSVSGSRRL